MVRIEKNFLKEKDFKHLEDIMFARGNFFPWYLNPVVKKDDHQSQLVHLFYYNNKINSKFFKDLTPILNRLKPERLIRIKANLCMKTATILEHGYHIDYHMGNIPLNFITAILYLNSNNGYTGFKKGKKIKSERNKLLKFNGEQLHTSSTCTDKEYRAVINFNYIL